VNPQFLCRQVNIACDAFITMIFHWLQGVSSCAQSLTLHVLSAFITMILHCLRKHTIATCSRGVCESTVPVQTVYRYTYYLLSSKWDFIDPCAHNCHFFWFTIQ
jgi:hypothetical protein